MAKHGFDGKLSVEINMTIHDRIYEGKMTYPDSFPDSPPYIRPRDRSERWPNHQYGEGGHCVCNGELITGSLT